MRRKERPDPNMAPFGGTCFRDQKYKECPRYRYLHEENKEIRDFMAKMFNVNDLYAHKLPLNGQEINEEYPLLDDKNGEREFLPEKENH